MTTTEQPPTYYLAYGSGRLLSELAHPLTDHDNAILSKQVMACVHGASHTAKPPKHEMAAISNAISKCPFKPYTLAELAKAISMGCSVLPADCGGTRKKEAWKAQQLWFVDVDNDAAMQARGYKPLEYTRAVERCAALNLPLVMSYETFSSSTPDNPDPAAQRYRLVFAKDEVVTDQQEAEQFAAMLLLAFPECDQSTTQANRYFLGTEKEVCLWLRAFK